MHTGAEQIETRIRSKKELSLIEKCQKEQEDPPGLLNPHRGFRMILRALEHLKEHLEEQLYAKRGAYGRMYVGMNEPFPIYILFYIVEVSVSVD